MREVGGSLEAELLRLQDSDPVHRTDLGNAVRLVRRHGRNLRFVAPWRAWLVWDGRRWRRDTTAEIYRRAKDTVRAMYAEAELIEDADERKKMGAHATRSESEARLRAMVKLAESEPEIAIAPDQLDADPLLVNVLNGTLDLRAGELRQHRRVDLLTKLAPVEHDPDARLDVWDRFLADATGGDDALEAFLRRAVGYSLSGDTSEEVLFMLIGPAATGKSTFVEAIKATLGDYAATADFESFLARRDAGGPGNDIARLAGARFVVSVEVDEGKRLAEGLVKIITGGDTVTARFLYREAFEFVPAFKLWLAANHAPKVRDDDEAMWRRIKRVPFEAVVPKDRRDPRMKATLRDPKVAGPAILAWVLRGCVEWQRDGLGSAPAVERSTSAYRGEMDPLSDFIAERCILAPEAWVRASELWDTWDAWTRANQERGVLTRKAFSDRLKDRGCVPDRCYIAGKRHRAWQGIGLADESSNA